jgi:hypothetical protein
MLLRTLLTGALLLLGSAATQEPKQVGFRDDFAADSRPNYTVRGNVAWQKGRLLLTEGARLQRPLTVGHAVDVRAVVRLAPGKDNVHLALTLSDGPERVRLELVRADG